MICISEKITDARYNAFREKTYYADFTFANAISMFAATVVLNEPVGTYTVGREYEIKANALVKEA